MVALSVLDEFAFMRRKNVQTLFVYFHVLERTASVYIVPCRVGLEICARKLEEHTRMLIVSHCRKDGPNAPQSFVVCPSLDISLS